MFKTLILTAVLFVSSGRTHVQGTAVQNPAAEWKSSSLDEKSLVAMGYITAWNDAEIFNPVCTAKRTREELDSRIAAWIQASRALPLTLMTEVIRGVDLFYAVPDNRSVAWRFALNWSFQKASGASAAALDLIATAGRAASSLRTSGKEQLP